MSFHSYRQSDAANFELQSDQVPAELTHPLVNLHHESLPDQPANQSAIPSMLLSRLNEGRLPASDNLPLQLASDGKSFEDALSKEFPDKYKILKDNAKNLRLELCLPPDASLEQIAQKLYKLKRGEIGRYDCRQA